MFQGLATATGGLAEDVTSQWQYHMGEDRTQWQGVIENARRLRFHGPREFVHHLILTVISTNQKSDLFQLVTSRLRVGSAGTSKQLVMLN